MVKIIGDPPLDGKQVAVLTAVVGGAGLLYSGGGIEQAEMLLNDALMLAAGMLLGCGATRGPGPAVPA